MNSIRSLFGKSGGGGGGGAGSSGSTLGGGIGKPDPQVAINKLKENLEMLDKREKFLQQKADEQTKIAKTLATKNKSAALMALKKKKQYMDQIEKIMGTRQNMETQVMAIESANFNLTILDSMKSGAQALGAIQSKIDADKVADTMDDINEQMSTANEVADAISRPMGGSALFDDDELAAELDALVQEDLDEKLLGTGLGAVPAIPSVPTTAIPAIAQPPRPTKAQSVEDDEDAELAQLKAEMAM